MDWSEKIDNKKYWLGTVAAVVIGLFAAKWNIADAVILLTVIGGSVLNQWLMFVILGKLLSRMSDEARQLSLTEKLTLWIQVALKFSILGAIFYYLILYARHVVAQGLLLYTFQLIILILSIKNIGDFINKGSSE
jgi:hypothetical protein